MSLKEMDTTQLLDLFGTGGGGGATTGGDAVTKKKQSGLQAMLSTMGELWDESQYTSEFDIGSFMGRLGPAAAAGGGQH